MCGVRKRYRWYKNCLKSVCLPQDICQIVGDEKHTLNQKHEILQILQQAQSTEDGFGKQQEVRRLKLINDLQEFQM